MPKQHWILINNGDDQGRHLEKRGNDALKSLLSNPNINQKRDQIVLKNLTLMYPLNADGSYNLAPDGTLGIMEELRAYKETVSANGDRIAGIIYSGHGVNQSSGKGAFLIDYRKYFKKYKDEHPEKNNTLKLSQWLEVKLDFQGIVNVFSTVEPPRIILASCHGLKAMGGILEAIKSTNLEQTFKGVTIEGPTNTVRAMAFISSMEAVFRNPVNYMYGPSETMKFEISSTGLELKPVEPAVKTKTKSKPSGMLNEMKKNIKALEERAKATESLLKKPSAFEPKIEKTTTNTADPKKPSKFVDALRDKVRGIEKANQTEKPKAVEPRINVINEHANPVVKKK